MQFFLNKQKKIFSTFNLLLIMLVIMSGNLSSIYKEIVRMDSTVKLGVVVSTCQQNNTAKTATTQNCQDNSPKYFFESFSNDLNLFLLLLITLAFNYVLAPLKLSRVNDIFKPPRK